MGAVAISLPNGDTLVRCGELVGTGDNVGLDDGSGVAHVVPASRVKAVPATMPVGSFVVPRSELRWHLFCALAARLLDPAERAAVLQADDDEPEPEQVEQGGAT